MNVQRGSKHSRKPGEGEVNLSVWSTLKKRMRAARRDKIWVYDPSPRELARHIHPRYKRAA